MRGLTSEDEEGAPTRIGMLDPSDFASGYQGLSDEIGAGVQLCAALVQVTVPRLS